VSFEITPVFALVLLIVMGGGCGSGAIVLGFGGPDGGSTGTDALPIDGGAGVTGAAAGAGGNTTPAQAGTLAGSSGQATGASEPSGTLGGAGMVAADGGGNMRAGAGGSGSGLVTQMSIGCGTDPPATGTSIQAGPMRASYIVDAPTGYDNARPYPLILAFRSAGAGLEQFRSQLGLAQVVRGDAIVVNVSPSNGTATWDGPRDLPMFDALLTELQSRYCVDELRVFAAGHGSGGLFTYALGCMRAGKLRAIASMSAGPTPRMCSGAIAVWIAQGTGDPMLAGGRASRDYWAARSGCDDVTDFTQVDPEPCVEIAGCAAGFAVRYCEYDGDMDLPPFAATGLWEFFKGF
jgi:polyhydroxybutyrate depolymerase